MRAHATEPMTKNTAVNPSPRLTPLLRPPKRALLRRLSAALASCAVLVTSTWLPAQSTAPAEADEPAEQGAERSGNEDSAKRPRMRPGERADARRRRGRQSTAPKGFASPHGSRPAQPRIVPAPDLPPGEIEVRLNSRGLDSIENQELILDVTQQSIERGNTQSALSARTDARGVARFGGQSMESDFVYQVRAQVGAAQYSTHQFQFKSSDTGGLRVILPVFAAQSELEGMLLLSRVLYALIPQDDLFVVDVLWRLENYSDVSWVPDNVVLPLPEGFKALTVKNEDANARFEPAGDEGVKFAGTFSPGQHDLLFRFHLPTEGESERTLKFPTFLNVGTVRVLLDASPTMSLEVADFGKPQETRNPQGQRRLILSRDYVSSNERPPKEIEVRVAGIPTPPRGRLVAVVLASAIALAGVGQSLTRRRYRSSARSQLSKEDLERATELLLDELVQLEQAFQQGAIGRKTHDQARRQLIEAFARLGAERQVRA